MDAIYAKLIEFSTPEWIEKISKSIQELGNKKSHLKGFDAFEKLQKLYGEEDQKYIGRTMATTIINTIEPLLDYINESKKSIIPLLHALDKLIPVLLRGKESQITYFSKIRSIIRNKYGADSREYRKSKTEMYSEETKRRNREYIEKVARNAGDVSLISKEDYVDLFKKVYKSDNIYDLIIAAIMASGSRFIEIMNIANYMRDPSNENYVIQTGIAKAAEGDKMKIKKPILFIKVSKFLHIMDKIRGEFDEKIAGKSNEEITSAFNGNVNRRLQEITDGKLGQITTHKLRAAYGSMAYEEYGNEKETLHKFLSRVLGHNKHNITTAASYANTKVISGKGAELEDDKKNEIEEKEEDKEKAKLVARIKELEEITKSLLGGKVEEKSRDEAKNIIIHNASKEIRESGKRVTYSALRQKTGYGSSTIANYMKWIRENHIEMDEDL